MAPTGVDNPLRLTADLGQIVSLKGKQSQKLNHVSVQPLNLNLRRLEEEARSHNPFHVNSRFWPVVAPDRRRVCKEHSIPRHHRRRSSHFASNVPSFRVRFGTYW